MEDVDDNSEAPAPDPAVPPERIKVWVLSGGCCALCGRYLLEGGLTARILTLGEVAHNVGRTRSARSPRGDSDMPLSDRGRAENLMLLCAQCHGEVDNKEVTDLATIEWLRQRKQEHESWIRQLVALSKDRETAILRMVGTIDGSNVELTSNTAASTVVRSAARYPRFALSYDNRGIEIDLRAIAGEAEATPEYWSAARAIIDQAIERRLMEAVRLEQVRHVSVFAFAKLPLLIYLGSRLDDTYQVDVYQRHRPDGTWDWSDGDPVAFVEDRPTQLTDEVVLQLNISGEVDQTQIPSAIRDLPRIVIRPDRGAPRPDIIGAESTLAAFEATVRSMFSGLEEGGKVVRRIHVLGALPVSAGVVLGQAHRRSIDPPMALYQFIRGSYSEVLAVH